MKKNILLVAAAFCGVLFATEAKAQEVVVVEDVTVSEVPCKDITYSTAKDNWFIQLGAGINAPFLENYLPNGEEKHHITAAYNIGVGKWMTPYLGWRLSALGGSLHWDNGAFSKAKYGNLNFDLMWDMFNSLGGVNTKRVFSIVPFVGLGGTFAWDFEAPASNIIKEKNNLKHNQWTLPVSAGLQFRFRLSDKVDFFAEGRAQFYGDNFNNCSYGDPVDVNITAIGGFTFHLTGHKFGSVNPCNYIAYIEQLNGQINDLRGELANCGSRLAAAEAQLPCPEVKETKCPEVAAAPLMSTVRFTINSAKISNSEMVNVYNVAEWMKANPEAKVVVTGYADKNTGSSSYNKTLSQKRAENVVKALEGYGIASDRLSIKAEGSDVQPYDTNNWNRIVIFSQN